MNSLRLFLLLIASFVYAEELAVFQQIADICHPSPDDLKQVQNALLHEERPILKRLGDKEQIIRNFRIIGDGPDEQPMIYAEDVNVLSDIKENCAICYSSFNERYPLGCKRLFLRIVHSDFKGHVECRIGGWPDLEAGSLPMTSVPFAFKVCFLKEMQRRGYKRVLWMDSSIMPVVSLNKIFQIIAAKGYFVQKNSHALHPPYMDPELA
ncbi:MAG TPA: hypothetical protein VLF94_09080, partial [Chlamydiales bacterium]|nr:hypothetical protein [Chlamydiales bacterium]